MSLEQETSQLRLDQQVDALAATPGLASELFDVADTLESKVPLRRALADHSTPADARAAVVQTVFGDHISAAAVQVVQTAASSTWDSQRALMAGLERSAIRAELLSAHRADELDSVRDELFRLARTVQSNMALRDSLGDRYKPLGLRQDLIEDLLAGKARAATVVLAKRAVQAQQRTFAMTIEYYLELASELRNRVLARVTVAQPLSDAQTAKLRAQLCRIYGRDVDLETEIDRAVIGGVKVEIEDEVIDGTVASRIEQARRQLG